MHIYAEKIGSAPLLKACTAEQVDALAEAHPIRGGGGGRGRKNKLEGQFIEKGLLLRGGF